MNRWLMSLSMVVVLAGCSGEEGGAGTVARDAGVADGGGGEDLGSGEEDLGSGEEDLGSGEEDLGSGGEDAGQDGGPGDDDAGFFTGPDCAPDLPCPRGMWCDPRSMTCRPGCRADQDCGDGEVCDRAGHRCVPGGCRDDVYEPDGDQDRAVPRRGGVVDATLCPGDRDWSVIYAGHRAGVHVTMTYSPEEGVPSVALVDGSGAIIREAPGEGGEVDLRVDQLSQGAYWVRVASQGGPRLDYSLTLEIDTVCQDDDLEPNDDPGAAARIPAGPLELVACPHDRDWFEVEAEPWETVEVMVEAPGAEAPVELELWSQGAGELLGESTWEAPVATVRGGDPRGGPLLVSVGAGQELAYTLTVTRFAACLEDDGFEDDDAMDDPAPIAPGELGGLVVCPLDEDWYDPGLPMWGTLRATVVSDSEGVGIEVVGRGSGQVLAQGEPLDGGMTVTFTRDSEEVVPLLHVTKDGLGAAVYALDLALDLPAACEDDEFEDNDVRADAVPLPPPGAEIVLCYGDPDWFELELGLGEGLDLTPAWEPGGQVMEVRIVDRATGAELARRSSSEGSLRVTLDGEGSAPRRVLVRFEVIRGPAITVTMDYEITGGEPGQCEDDGFEDDDGPLQARLPDPEVEAVACPGDEDWWFIPMLQGETVTLTVSSDTRVFAELTDTAMVFASCDTSSGGCVLTHTSPRDGNYYLRLYTLGGDHGAYRFTYLSEMPLDCEDDGFEDDDSPEDATPFDGSIELVACPGDPDWVSFVSGPGDEVAVELWFDVHACVIRGTVYGPDMEVEAELAQTDFGAGVVFLPSIDGVHLLGITGEGEVGCPVSVSVTREPVGPGCEDDALEDNDSWEQASPIEPGLTEGLAICGGDEDWFGFSVQAGEVVTLTATPVGPQVALEIYGPWGFPRLGRGEPGDAGTTVQVTADADSNYFARIVPVAGEGPYSLRLELSAAE